MYTLPRYAVIPTHNRPSDLSALVSIIDTCVDRVIVVDNASDIPVTPNDFDTKRAKVTVLYDDEQPPNLSRLWNLAFDFISHEISDSKDSEVRWDVAVFNDDTVIPDGWFDAVLAALRTYDYPAIACSDTYGTLTEPILKTAPDSNIMTRMCPWAFIMRGELRMRADESLRWWYGDDHMARLAYQHGGIGIIPGYLTQNTKANTSTVGVLAEQAGRDRETFAKIWGNAPW